MSLPGPVLIYTDPRYRNGQLVAESQLLSEWLALRYPGVHSLGRLRLGPTAAVVSGVDLTPAQQAMLSVLNWYADAVILAPGEQLVVEAKVAAKPAAVGEVLFYMRLLSQTPELIGRLGVRFQPVVLFGEDDRAVGDFARSMGVRVEIHVPAWLPAYLMRVQFRGRGPR